MQFIVFMIPAVYQLKNGKQQPGPDFKPDPVMMEKMGKFNDELRKAGALQAVNGLQPIAAGARLAFTAGKVSVTDGPAVGAPEVVGGYWVVEAKSKQDVVDWWKRCPAQEGDVIEIREIAGAGGASSERASKARGTTRAPYGTRPPQPSTSTKSRGPWRKPPGTRTKEQD